jgi:hypothetical protein
VRERGKERGNLRSARDRAWGKVVQINMFCDVTLAACRPLRLIDPAIVHPVLWGIPAFHSHCSAGPGALHIKHEPRPPYRLKGGSFRSLVGHVAAPSVIGLPVVVSIEKPGSLIPWR